MRTHAAAIESFARIPRMGINIINGNKEGMMAFNFVPTKVPKVENLYSNVLIMKFAGGRPSLETA